MTDRDAMQMLASFEGERERQFRRLLGFSTIAHAALLLLFLGLPRSPSSGALPGVVRVDLVAVAPAAAPRPTAARPKPKPKPPVPEKVVLPEQPTAKPAPKPVESEPREEPQIEYEELLAQLRERAGEDPEAGSQAAAGPPLGSGGAGILVTPEVMAWMRRAKVHVTRAWVLAPGFRTQALETEIRVRLASSGEVLDTRIIRRSGNPWFDESVERAIRKASPLPAPPEGDEWPFVFRPQDVL